jgi:hypothetical protein
MNKFLIGSIIVALILGAYGTFRPYPTSAPTVGAQASPDHYNYEQFFSGMSSKYLDVNGALSTSSSTPAAYGSASSFQMVVPAAATVGRASTTAVTSVSNRVTVQQRGSTGIAGTTCNTAAIATGTLVSLTASSTSLSSNGVTITVPSAPVTNPYCFDVTVFR